MGQHYQNVPAKKPSTIVTDAPEIAFLFEGELCQNRHPHHADLSGGRCSSCQVWPWEMCRRFALG
eukprot:1206850-Amphidinium_carterae.1